jgi:hypothetical protein
MTYIVAFGQPGLNAIIADTRVSWLSKAGVPDNQDIGLKVGPLFPGCIYGVTCNDDTKVREFIRSFKESIYGLNEDALSLWLDSSASQSDIHFRQSD